MKTLKYLLFMMMAGVLSNVSAQEIPNNGFETWGLYNTWTYEPESWETSNNQILEYVTMDSAAYEGDFAMKVGSESLSASGYGQITMPIGFIPDKLGFYVKTEALGIPFFSVKGTFYYLGEEVTSTEWYTSETIAEWTYQELDFDNIEPLVDEVVIRVETVLGDFVYANGWVSVDEFEFAGFNSIEENKGKNSVVISPNPTRDYFRIEGDIKNNSPIEIYDLLGNLLERTIYSTQLDVTHLETGIYLISYRSEDDSTQTKRLVKSN